MDFVLAIVLALHLLCVNISMAGPWMCIWLEWRSRRLGNLQYEQTGRNLAVLALVSLLVGAVIGAVLVLLLWMTGDTKFFEIVRLLRSKIECAAWEFFFSLVCLVIYLVWWRFSGRRSAVERASHRLLAILASTNLMYHFPPLFTIIGKLKTADFAVDREIDAAMFRSLMYTSEVLAMTLHFWLAAFATTGVVVMVRALGVSLFRTRNPSDANLARTAARGALAVSLIQLPVGVWLLTTLSQVPQSRILGGTWTDTISFVAALIATLGLLHQLVSVSLGETTRHAALRTFGLLSLVVLLMNIALVRSRHREQRPTSVEAVQLQRRDLGRIIHARVDKRGLAPSQVVCQSGVADRDSVPVPFCERCKAVPSIRGQSVISRATP